MIGAIASHYVAAGAPAFNPKSISGLVAWYSAQAETGYSDGQAMTQWTDLSGNGRHAGAGGTNVPKWRAATGPGGGPCVEWGTGNSRFNMPAGSFTGASAAEVMAVLKSTANQSSGAFWKFGTSGSDTHYPFTDSNVYDDFAATSRPGWASGGTAALSSWHRLNSWSAANDRAYRINEVSKYTSASNTVSIASAPIIGSAGGGTWAGGIACLVVYSRKLTTTERDQLAAWLTSNMNGGTL